MYGFFYARTFSSVSNTLAPPSQSPPLLPKPQDENEAPLDAPSCPPPHTRRSTILTLQDTITAPAPAAAATSTSSTSSPSSRGRPLSSLPEENPLASASAASNTANPNSSPSGNTGGAGGGGGGDLQTAFQKFLLKKRREAQELVKSRILSGRKRTSPTFQRVLREKFVAQVRGRGSLLFLRLLQPS
jgi:hypothetical protein